MTLSALVPPSNHDLGKRLEAATEKLDAVQAELKRFLGDKRTTDVRLYYAFVIALIRRLQSLKLATSHLLGEVKVLMPQWTTSSKARAFLVAVDHVFAFLGRLMERGRKVEQKLACEGSKMEQLRELEWDFLLERMSLNSDLGAKGCQRALKLLGDREILLRECQNTPALRVWIPSTVAKVSVVCKSLYQESHARYTDCSMLLPSA